MGGGDRPKVPAPPPPAPMPKTQEEVEEAKKKVKKRARVARGLESTILAGRMMAERTSPSELKSILGA